MNSDSNQRVTLRVYLSGAIAYVPDPDGVRWWALLPNGLVASPAQWHSTRDPQYLKARASHFALFLTDKKLIDKKRTTADISTIFEPWDADDLPRNASYPLTPSRKVVALLLRNRLDFGLIGKNLHIEKDVQEFVPAMKEISPDHSMVDHRYLPGSKGFSFTALSSAICFNTGTLSVGGFFDDKTKVDFGRVVVNASGDLKFDKRAWKKPIANHLIWNVPLPVGQRRVTIESTDWKKNNPTRYSLVAPRGRNLIEVAILHSEMEIPTLFLEDPVYPRGIKGFPDPDFELFYSISSNQGQLDRWRVPVPNSQTAGKIEKPCSNGMFAGFA